MRLLLSQSIKGVGERGAIVEVRDGFAMNYLIPKGLATVATVSIVEAYKADQLNKEHARAAHDEKLRAMAERLGHVRVTLAAPAAATGHLFGAIAPRAIVRALATQGFEIPEKSVILTSKIDRLGAHAVTVHLSKEFEPTIHITVVNDHHEKR